MDCNKQKKSKNHISQMRLRSEFKMRVSILSEVTIEQMGYMVL
ncbi:hypothetical protein [Anaerobutyricum hallii]